jgi:hypothetical protein
VVAPLRAADSAAPASSGFGYEPVGHVRAVAPASSSIAPSGVGRSLEPSGAVPRPDAVASGSGPHHPLASASSPSPSAASPIASPIAAERIAVPTNSGEALRAWDQVLGELTDQRKLSLAGPFEHARVMTWTAELLDLGFPVAQHAMGEMAKDSTDELRAVIRAMSPVAFKTLRVTVRLLDAAESQAAGARSILETTREHKSVERGKREAEARAHPITKHVLQTFGAQIKEIKTDV